MSGKSKFRIWGWRWWNDKTPDEQRAVVPLIGCAGAAMAGGLYLIVKALQ